MRSSPAASRRMIVSCDSSAEKPPSEKSAELILMERMNFSSVIRALRGDAGEEERRTDLGREHGWPR